MAGTFRAFKNPNYRLYIGGQSVSQIGTWMQRTAVSWVIYSMTHSSFMLGLSVFASQFPSFLFSLYGGIIADRYQFYKITLITQLVALLQSALLAALVLLHHETVWAILGLSVVLGVVNAFDIPARPPLVHEIINDPADLSNAIAFNSSMNNIARLIGPAASGLVLQHFGAGCCFLLNAVSFVAVIVSLLLMKLPPYQPAEVKKPAKAQLKEGLHYLKTTPSLTAVLWYLALASLLVFSYNTLLPVFAKVIFKGDAATFGYINSFVGLGAFVGTIFLASLKPGAPYRKILMINCSILGVALIVFSRLSWFPAAMAVAALAGFGTQTQTSLCNTIVQTESDSRMRGRVISFLAMSIYGMLPVGSLLLGLEAKAIGAPDSLLIQGILALVIAAVFSRILKPPAQTAGH